MHEYPFVGRFVLFLSVLYLFRGFTVTVHGQKSVEIISLAWIIRAIQTLENI